jgi:hypothetical protein
VKHITKMLKKDSEIKWGVEARQSFIGIKQSLIEAPVLVGPDFNKDLLLFHFSSEHTIARVLFQKNYQNLEHPTTFYSEL